MYEENNQWAICNASSIHKSYDNFIDQKTTTYSEHHSEITPSHPSILVKCQQHSPTSPRESVYSLDRSLSAQKDVRENPR